jgi:hypothetical protein
LLVAGALRAVLPDADFTLEWRHSVQKTPWREHYRADGDGLVLDVASIEGTGAGMEPPSDAVQYDGRWVWYPHTRLPELRLTYSRHAADYTLCGAQSGCRTLAGWTGALEDGAVVTVGGCGGIRPPAGAPAVVPQR